ncbi:SDR family oxidoreductase [Sphingomicrobium arenosum]|uniref:SDR family oxidoreductase n=1 Tax=Sphingomicrobium arenosum TaxID=2233861 RepID=UPI00223E9280|nr:SDR family oxidoreductase [Sphingomicrobium arenosum]
MNILIAGATGNTGARLTRQLDEAGHHPIAMIRDGSDTSVLPQGVETRTADLTDLADNVCEGADVVIFAAGSGGDTSEEMTDKVDRDGAKALIDRAKAQGVQRFVMLSSIGAGDPDPDSDLAHYLKAKHAADEHLKASGLDYVILRPVALTEEDGNRNLTLGDDVDPEGKAHRGDVAAVLARAVDNDMLRNKVVELQSN